MTYTKAHRTLLLLGATVLSTHSAFSATTSSQATPNHKRHHHPASQAAQPVVAPVVQQTAPASATGVTSARQATVTQAQTDATQLPVASSGNENIVVTGTLFHDPNATSSSEITHITRRDMAARGLKTANDIVQQLSSNGAGNLTSQWSAGGGFSPGGSAPSLRGLSTDSTLVLIDGQRNSYYPLADDGERNYVDTTWIPQSILESTDVLQDGGSATYGADAVAGVVNFTTRKEIKGFEGNAEGGLTQRGDAGHQRLYATYGHGDLNNDGYNFYVNSEYQQDDPLYYRQLQSPFNNGDLTGIGGSNGNTNTLMPGTNQFNSTYTGATPTAIARPFVNGAGVGGYGLLNPAAGCGSLPPVTGTGFTGGSDTSTTQACTQNAKQYSMIAPDIRRVSATAHFTANVTDNSQLVAMFNWSQARTVTTGTPSAYAAATQSELVTTSPTVLPWQLPNGQLNPNDPYAAQHEDAQAVGLFHQIPVNSDTSNNFRGSVRYSGWAHSDWGSDWDYNADFVGMNTLLNQVQTGEPYISHLQNAITNGTYNFVNPSQNSQSVINYIMPPATINARSQEYSGQATLSKGLFKLPGGMARLAIGGNIRYEAVNDPNANPLDLNNPGNQWASYNPVDEFGHRWVEAGFYEVSAPIVKQFNIDTSGRFDHYSEGFSHFSPKVGFQFKPIKQITLRGTFNRGFRVPSFAETGGQTEGFVPVSWGTSPAVQAWQNTHGNDSYVQSGNYLGQLNVGNPNLKPEVSTSYTIGPVFKPTNWMTLSFEYYYIKKNHYITSGILNPNEYFNQWIENGGTNAGMPAGITVVQGPKDSNYPNALAAPAYVAGEYINAKSQMTDGFDMSISAHAHLPGALHNILWYSNGSATFVRRFNQVNPDGSVYRFAGTLGPYAAVSASGTPRWRANWANTFAYKNLSVTPTVYYTSGYKTVADDSGVASPGANGLYSHSCANALGSASVQVNGPAYPTQCRVKGFWDVDMTVNYQINKRWSMYANVYNLLGFRAPLDYATYGGYLYNSSWSQKGVIMRSFQFGVNVTL
ncbi:TonB-dependent receptor [Neoasaia chiangmaiensis]|uniref:TonB-dependent receptor n=2 Tax=Neoasaia chiangmaiensis TaxID=320497 RepID=A0A1U9KQ95_9PROT|nr:TonB-dependent receptor [Neoasaia chiangmaiensis]AQS87978.1 TonB-dependent receptor [Neoasaia chiangmaiensis]GEN15639.1 TonB-dependent receptor [Neoasaia chiangmaiensis]